MLLVLLIDNDLLSLKIYFLSFSLISIFWLRFEDIFIEDSIDNKVPNTAEVNYRTKRL